MSVLMHSFVLSLLRDKEHPMNTFDLSHIPVLFSGMDTFESSQASFLATFTNIGNSDRDRLFCSKVKMSDH